VTVAAPMVVNPASIPGGTVGVPYSVTFTHAGGTGNATFTTSGSLPAGLALNNTTLSGTPSSTGEFPFRIIATDANGCSGNRDYSITIAPMAPPANLTATAITTTRVDVAWTTVAGAHHYDVIRDGAIVASPMTNAYSHLNAAPGTVYVYRVRAVPAAGAPSADSIADVATTVSFTDDPDVAGATVIRAVHMTELRSAVNLVRAAAGLAPFSFSDAQLAAGMTIKGAYVRELRTALDAARAALPLPAVTWPPIVDGSSPITAADLNAIRNAIR
jgi:Putative Ig domain